MISNFRFKLEDTIWISLVLIFLIRGILWSIYIVPPVLGSAPDDVGHFSYIQYVASEKQLPVLFETLLETVSWDMCVDYGNIPLEDVLNATIDQETFSSPRENWIAQHPPLYYLVMVPIYMFSRLITNRVSTIIIILRLFTMLSGIITLCFLKRLTDLLNCKLNAKICIWSLFTLSTPILYYFVNINNDSLLICLCLVCLYYLLDFKESRKKSSFLLFAISGSAIMMTKYTGALVLVGYLIYFLYFSLYNDGIKSTMKRCICGLIIASIIMLPFLLRNYHLYHNPLKTFDNNTRIYDFSVKQFFEADYIKQVYNACITLMGNNVLVYAPNILKTIPAIILEFTALMNILYQKNKKIRFILLFSNIIIILYLILSPLDPNDIVALYSVIFILVCSILSSLKNKEQLELNLFFILTSLIVIIIYGYEHYIIYCHRGNLGAMHGRYYYIVLFPAVYLLFKNYDNFENKLARFFPVALIILMTIFDLKMVNFCLERW